MRISTIALGLTLGLLWGAAFFVIGMIYAVFPGYGAEFYQLAASLYPGMKGDGSPSDFILGTAYGLVDGFLFGVLMAWLYNLILTKLVAPDTPERQSR